MGGRVRTCSSNSISILSSSTLDQALARTSEESSPRGPMSLPSSHVFFKSRPDTCTSTQAFSINVADTSQAISLVPRPPIHSPPQTSPRESISEHPMGVFLDVLKSLKNRSNSFDSLHVHSLENAEVAMRQHMYIGSDSGTLGALTARENARAVEILTVLNASAPLSSVYGVEERFGSRTSRTCRAWAWERNGCYAANEENEPPARPTRFDELLQTCCALLSMYIHFDCSHVK